MVLLLSLISHSSEMLKLFGKMESQGKVLMHNSGTVHCLSAPENTTDLHKQEGKQHYVTQYIITKNARTNN